MSKTMRAVIVDKNNKDSASALSIGEIALPEVKDQNHALVRVKAFGLNRMDIMQRQGLYPVPPQAPDTLGVEFSGVVETAGSSSGWKQGDEV
jgi:NADPH:quinone reductase-like Zn-dependent oxidoreductase